VIAQPNKNEAAMLSSREPAHTSENRKRGEQRKGRQVYPTLSSERLCTSQRAGKGVSKRRRGRNVCTLVFPESNCLPSRTVNGGSMRGDVGAC